MLVVDDELLLRRTWERNLTRAGYLVEIAPDGTAAAVMLSERTFDVILSDISMPSMDGIQLLELVRGSQPDLPVVLMTGNPSLETAMRAIEHGAVSYIAKPAKTDLVLDALARACATGRETRLRREAMTLLDSLEQAKDERADLSQSFDRALSSLWMAYQPIVRWSTKGTLAYEALLRCTEPAFPNPGVLLSAAEQLGRVLDLGAAIRGSIAATMSSVPSEGDIFVNLHSLDLADATLYEVDAPLTKHSKRVVLEITERDQLDDIEDTAKRIAALRALGFRIAVDDLGAGYAGLTSFALLSPDVVKLDMSIIRNVDRELIKQNIVRSIAALCAQMNMLVVAEGVETAAERDMLISLGCDVFQGYLFGRPVRPFATPTW